MGRGSPKPRGPSPEELRARREQIAALKREREEAEAEKQRLADLEKKRKEASKRRRSGRGSLIATSELGVTDTLG